MVEQYQIDNAWWLAPGSDFSSPYIPPSLQGNPVAQQWVSDNQAFVGVGGDVAMLIALIKLKGAVIKLAGRYLWAVPAAAYGSALATILAVERLVGKKEANELSQWYADAVSDPYAWHVETDRVVQGAAHALIEDFTQGVVTAPGVAADLGTSAYSWAYLSRINDWRTIGAML
jgi:hypothetical protein